MKNIIINKDTHGYSTSSNVSNVRDKFVHTAKATARELARELAAATTSGAGSAKKQSKVFGPGGGM
jgi:hypothetical protein